MVYILRIIYSSGLTREIKTQNWFIFRGISQTLSGDNRYNRYIDLVYTPLGKKRYHKINLDNVDYFRVIVYDK